MDKGQKYYNAKRTEKFKTRAKDYINNKEKVNELLEEAILKANRKRSVLSEVWDKLQLLFDIVRDWVKGRYKGIPTGSILMIIVGLIYFISPIDIVPDFIVGMGFLDDAAVLGFIINQIKSDLETYKAWREGKGSNEA